MEKFSSLPFSNRDMITTCANVSSCATRLVSKLNKLEMEWQHWQESLYHKVRLFLWSWKAYKDEDTHHHGYNLTHGTSNSFYRWCEIQAVHCKHCTDPKAWFWGNPSENKGSCTKPCGLEDTEVWLICREVPSYPRDWYCRRCRRNRWRCNRISKGWSSVSNFQTHNYKYVSIQFLLGRVTQGEYRNDYAGFQQYALAYASTVAKVSSVPLFSRGIANASLRFLPTFRTMKLLLCLSPSRRRTSVCTTKTLLVLDWFHLYLPRAEESTLETPFLSLVDPVPLVRMVSLKISPVKKGI